MLTLQECYKILGLNPQASSQEVRQAYLKLVKQWHPDSQEQSGQAHPQAQDRFLQIQKAYEQIKQHQESGAETIPEPKPSASSRQPSTSTKSTSTHLNAEILYANASDLGRQGLYQDAIAELSRAIRVDPNYAMAYKYRGYLRSLLGLERQAEADLNKARVLESIGSSTPQTPADIEAMAREYASPRRRSPFRSKLRFRRPRKSPSTKLIWAALGIAGIMGISILVTVLSVRDSRQIPSSPIQIETPFIDS